jgi:Zn-dependent protease with chaperone function
MKTTILQENSKIERLTKLGLDFIENQWELARLIFAEKAAASTSKVLGIAMISIFGFFMIIFLSVGIAYWIGSEMGNLALGFFIISLLYFILMIVSLMVVKPIIEKKIAQSIINTLDNEDE